jgi:NADH-quinone oxidoreductase subunit L
VLAGLLFGGERGLLAGYWGLGRLMASLGDLLVKVESGYVRLYAFGLGLGGVLLLLWGVLR